LPFGWHLHLRFIFNTSMNTLVEPSYKRIAMSALALLGIALTGPSFAQAVAKPLVTDPIYTQPQQLEDMDHGRRMNIYCLGAGSPVVILNAGLGGDTSNWALVQNAIAAKTKVCAFDRAGLGFSDGTKRASTASNSADDLHTLLKAADIAPPYILVGHSAAGMYDRVFADRYVDEVAGMVQVESSHEDQSTRGWSLGDPGQKEKWDIYLKEGEVCLEHAKRGLVKGTPEFKKCVGEPDPRFSDAINEAQAQFAVTLRWQAASISERQAIFYESADQTRATRRSFGDMPIIVLTHSPYPKAKDETQELRDKRTLQWESMHLEVAAMSSRGINAIVPKSGHYIQLDQPQVVVDSVNQVLMLARDKLQQRPATAAK
jgi:pimeloyl-ACP methyl ester carboxylesterase